MGAPLFTAADFARAFRALLPRGRVWPLSDDSVQTKVLEALGLTYERQTARSTNLLVDAFPATTVELLPEWEKTLGLPDPCAGPSPTLQARQAQVLARFIATGGQAAAYFIAYALELGYVITIENFAPFRTGVSHTGDPLAGDDWWFVWAVHAPLNEIKYFRTGQSAAGEPLAYWSNTVLECELEAIKPSHTFVFFEYS